MHEIIGIIVVIIGIGLHAPYLYDSIKGNIKPHPFTWILWTLLTIIVFVAQVADGAGPGAWGTGAVGAFCIAIMLSSLRHGFNNIKKVDIMMLIIGLMTIPLWMLANDPTLSVVIIVVIDLLAFAPTFRKSYHKPYDEPLYLPFSNIVRHGLSIFAIVNITIATTLFPFMVGLANVALAIFLIWRRRHVEK